MPYVWNGNKRLYRTASRDESHVEPGDEFEPTEAEKDTFGRYIEYVEPDESDANPEGSSDESGETEASESDEIEDPAYSEMDYEELRQLAADADTDEVNGSSSKEDIVAYFEGQ